MFVLGKTLLMGGTSSYIMMKKILQVLNSSLVILGITILQGAWSANLLSFLSAAQIKEGIDLVSVLMQRKGITESSLVFCELSSFLLCQLKHAFSGDAGYPSTDFIKQRAW